MGSVQITSILTAHWNRCLVMYKLRFTSYLVGYDIVIVQTCMHANIRICKQYYSS